jgi:hypothetical protein
MIESPFGNIAGFSNPFRGFVGKGFPFIPAFSPAVLFASGEQGAWYEPSPTTALLSTTDLTPCGVGDSCGFLLDKSQGAGYSGGSFTGLGDELVTNGTFDTDISGWSSGDVSTISFEGGTLRSQRTDNTQFSPQAGQQITGISDGATVLIEFDVTLVRNRNPAIAWASSMAVGATITAIQDNNTVGSYTIVSTFNSAKPWLVFYGGGSADFNIDNISVRELPGNHATQDIFSRRPILRQLAGGEYYLEFDGIDDSLVTGIITPGTDKAQVFAGVRKLSDAARALLFETSTAAGWNSGTLAMFAPDQTTTNGDFGFYSRGTVLVLPVTRSGTILAPTTQVITGLGDIPADLSIIRANGVQVGAVTDDQGTGNYLAYPLFIGARNQASLRFNGHIYSLIVRFGPNLDTPTIENVEGYVANKTGITL